MKLYQTKQNRSKDPVVDIIVLLAPFLSLDKD